MSRIEEALAKAAQRQAIPAPSPGSTKSVPSRQSPPLDAGGITNEKLVVLKTPSSPEAEEFRKIKEALFKGTPDDGETLDNVFLITSPGTGEGKSLVSVNLAISLAQEYDHTVLLIDADLRKPTCHKYLEIPSGPGLAECLTDGVDLGEVLIKTGLGNLTLLPAGKQVKNHLELFSSNNMRQLILEIKHRYHDRIVLIDTPPVLMFAETRTLASQVDAVIMVVREGGTSLEDVQESMDLLNNKVRGLVYNASEFVQHGHYSYYSYSECPA